MEDKENRPVYEERDASFDPDPEIDLSEDEIQEGILADSGMNAFQKYVARMDDRKWNLAQRIGGAILGILASVSLFWEGIAGGEADSSVFSFPLVIAVVIAMLVPNIIEKQSLRKCPKLRTTVALTLLVCIIAFVAYTGFTKGFSIKG